MRHFLPNKTFETLNGLRGIAALVIVVWHGGIDWFGGASLPGGYLVVDLFFVLSGFVIAHAYEKRLGAGLSVRKFLIIRIIRLYPLYFFGTMISSLALIYSLMGHGPYYEVGTIYYIPFALAMIPKVSSHLSSFVYPLDVPAWSLLLEIIINWVYALSYKYWSARNMVVVMSVSAALMLSNHWLPESEGWLNAGATWNGAPFGALRIFYSFPAGVLIYRMLCEQRVAIPRLNCVTLFLLLPLLLASNSGLACKISALVGIPMLVALAAGSEPNRLLKQVCAALGSASYAIYAIHHPLMALTRAAAESAGGDERSPVLGIVIIVAIVPVCLLLDKWYDMPIRRAVTKKLRNRSLYG